MIRQITERTRTFLALLFAFLFLVLLISGVSEYRNRRDSVMQLMSHMSRSLAGSVQQAAENSILQYDKVLEENEFRMLSALAALDRYEDSFALSPALLREWCREHRLLQINVYGTDGHLNMSSADSITALPADPRITPVIEEKQQQMILGIHAARGTKGERFSVAYGRYRGGAFLAQINAAELTELQRNLGLASLLNSLIVGTSVKYVAIQDSIGILAASRNIRELSSFNSDEFLRKVTDNNRLDHRITVFAGEHIYENVLPFSVNNTSYGLLRIGIDSSPMDEINRVAIRNAAIRFILLLVISFIMIAYSVLIQNNQLLMQEKERINTEVYRLQEDLRRREKLSAMGELAAGVAHEIRNPLNAMNLSAQRLLKKFDGPEDDKSRDLLQNIRHEIKRLDRIIRQFLEFSRPSALQKNTFSPALELKKIMDLYESAMLQAGVRLAMQLSSDESISADKEKFRQVMINLIENALKAMPGGGLLTLKLSKSEQKFRISIEDSGIGIPKENLPKIFNLYFTTRRDGSGLGLAQVYQVISEHNGSIRVESKVAKGSVFHIELPEK